MTEQEIREKVINGLVCNLNFITKSDCKQCRYNCEKTMFLSVPVDLLADTLALLKSQEPRAMSLEEVKSLKHEAVVWYEHNGVNKQRPRIVDQVYDSGIIFTDGGHWRFNADAYGKNFRLWTSSPTDEQRKAMKWVS